MCTFRFSLFTTVHWLLLIGATPSSNGLVIDSNFLLLQFHRNSICSRLPFAAVCRASFASLSPVSAKATETINGILRSYMQINNITSSSSWDVDEKVHAEVRKLVSNIFWISLKMLKLASIVKCLPPYFTSIMSMKIALRLRIILCLILVFKISCIS
ncbi:hypothetical protein P8452_18374 [Trifolium repens]|nr:hypothetical protein P8452_18374 [Trifolium repens]